MAALGGMTVLSLGLLAALVLAATDTPEAAQAAPAPTPSAQTPTPEADPGALFPAEPSPLPAETLTELESAGTAEVESEFDVFLRAVQMGFGDASVQLEPNLRPYLLRLAGRLAVRSDVFRVAVTAPDAALAEARAASLSRLFAAAGLAPDRIQIRAGTGPHQLSLITE